MVNKYGPTFCCRPPTRFDRHSDDAWWYDSSKQEWWLCWKGYWLNMLQSSYERAVFKSNLPITVGSLNESIFYRDFLLAEAKSFEPVKDTFTFTFREDEHMKNCTQESKNLNSLIDSEKFENIWTDFLEKYAAEDEYFDINDDYEFNDLEKTVLKAIAKRFAEAMDQLED